MANTHIKELMKEHKDKTIYEFMHYVYSKNKKAGLPLNGFCESLVFMMSKAYPEHKEEFQKEAEIFLKQIEKKTIKELL